MWLLDKVHEDLNIATKKKYRANKVVIDINKATMMFIHSSGSGSGGGGDGSGSGSGGGGGSGSSSSGSGSGSGGGSITNIGVYQRRLTNKTKFILDATTFGSNSVNGE